MSMWNSIVGAAPMFPELIVTDKHKQKIRDAFNAPPSKETLEQMKPYMVTQHPCLWDNFSSEEKSKPMGLSCSCPKCSCWC